MSMVTSDFIGRAKDITILDEWLLASNQPTVIYIHDALEEAEKKGGIGKTWLLNHYRGLVERQHQNIIPVAINFFDISDRSGVVIAKRVVQALRTRYPHWPTDDFEKTLQAYGQAVEKRRPEEILSFRERLADALANDVRRLHQAMFESNTSIVLFCDTFEQIEANPITAVLQSGQPFPDTYRSDRVRAVIAGRNAPNWKHPNWIGRESEVRVHALPPFSYEETVEYLQTRSEADAISSLPQQTLRALYERTEGRPILVGLVTDVLNNRIQTPEALIEIEQKRFEASLVEEINRFEGPGKWAIFAMAHVYHRFDAAFLEYLMLSPGLESRIPANRHYQELARELLTLSFVRHAGSGDFVLHDEMRRLVNQHCWHVHDQDGRMRRELSRLAIDYYTKLIQHETDEEKRRSYIVEKLFHELFFDRANGFQSFEQHFNQAIDFSQGAFARALFQELQKFEQQLSSEQYQVMKLAEAKVLRAEEDAQTALTKLVALEQDAGWTERYNITLIEEKGKCYLNLSEYDQAIRCFEACLKSEQVSRDLAHYEFLLRLSGYAYRRQGRYAEARHYYEAALKVQRNLDNPGEDANLLNNMSYVLHLQGKLEDALRLCKLALRIRRDLLEQGKIGEYDVGLSYSTLGHIYHTLGDVKEEENAYKAASDIYHRVGNKSDIAASYNNVGRAYVKKGELDKARNNFQQALRIASAGVYHPIEVESHNQLGRLALQQEQWEEAVFHLKQAVELARQAGIHFELAENLLYLAQALDCLGQPSLEYILEAKRIARKNNFSYLLARVGEIQGDMCLRKQDYLSAFKHYGISCRHIAERSSLEFDRTLRKLNDNLLGIPSNYLPGVIDVLRSYWSEEGLDEAYPQLPAVCKEVGRHMLL